MRRGSSENTQIEKNRSYLEKGLFEGGESYIEMSG